jgi:hypothetical protein
MASRRPLFVCVTFLVTLVAILLTASQLAAGQSEYLVYSFPKTGRSIAAGCTPEGSLVADSAGNFYGTTEQCGIGAGTVFKLTRPVPPSKQWVETVLYSFTGGLSGVDVRYPRSGVVFDSAGNLYGAAAGGANGLGAVFELSPPATEGGSWTESLLYSFKGGLTDGALTNLPWNNQLQAAEGVVLDAAGNLYGVTPFGGSGLQEYNFCQYGCGVAYKLTPPATAGGTWTETVLHSFKAKQGAVYAVGTPVFDAKGNLYGATQGAAAGHSLGAAAYRLTAPATEGGAWTYTLLYAFTPFRGLGDGPQSSLTFHNNGRLYGTTEAAGQYDGGTVFELVPPTVPGGAWTQNILHEFGNGTDGSSPLADVIFDKAGNLYSTTWIGGSGATSSSCYYHGCGTVFELSPPALEGGDWTETILHSFGPPPSTTDGSEPQSGLIVGKNGVLYGVTPYSGRGSAGTVFGIVP